MREEFAPPIPEHDFPEKGALIEIAFAHQVKPVKAIVLRHSRLVIHLSNGMTVPFHAVHWWKVIPTVKLEDIDEMPSAKELLNEIERRMKLYYNERLRIIRDVVTTELMEMEDIIEQSDDAANIGGVVGDCVEKIKQVLMNED